MDVSPTVTTDTDPGLKDSFLKALRTVTGPAHEALEQNPVTSVLMTPQVTLQDYIAYLQRLYGFVAPVEAKAYPAMTAIPCADKRIKAGLILEDLRALGIAEGLLQSLPQYNVQGMYDTDAAKIAAIYVLEGSTLGGNVIYKHLNKTIGLTPDKGGAYLTAYGPETGMMWKSFIEHFTGYAVIENNAEEIIPAAAETFARIDSWLSNQR